MDLFDDLKKYAKVTRRLEEKRSKEIKEITNNIEKNIDEKVSNEKVSNEKVSNDMSNDMSNEKVIVLPRKRKQKVQPQHLQPQIQPQIQPQHLQQPVITNKILPPLFLVEKTPTGNSIRCMEGHVHDYAGIPTECLTCSRGTEREKKIRYIIETSTCGVCTWLGEDTQSINTFKVCTWYCEFILTFTDTTTNDSTKLILPANCTINEAKKEIKTQLLNKFGTLFPSNILEDISHI